MWYNHIDLKWQYGYSGATLVNRRILVCDRCLDVPQSQNMAIVLPADPVPIVQARPQDFIAAETDYATLTGYTTDPNTGLPIPNTTILTTLDGSPMVMQPIGPPTGYVPNAQMPLVAGQKWSVQLPVVSMLSDGAGIITVTTSSPHGLSTNAQVGVQGVVSNDAAGAFSITVTTPTQFTYQTNPIVAYGSQLMAKTLVTTMNMGLPYGFTQIPQTGPT